MSRTYQQIVNTRIINLLTELTNKELPSNEYAQVMYNLGKEFGTILNDKVSSSTPIMLGCTVEDADYLGRGILENLEKSHLKTKLTVFWNMRFKTDGLSVAPIVKQYKEGAVDKNTVLVIVKSIISSSCVVRTNLTKLIEEEQPQTIYVVAPVLLKGAIQKLEAEFPPAITKQFQYFYFAEDDTATNGIVEPGIGGDIYQRLGFANQTEKNSFVPKIVKERRRRIVNS
ncbi:hypothetical protein [Flaviaesturariibacter terrae]